MVHKLYSNLPKQYLASFCWYVESSEHVLDHSIAFYPFTTLVTTYTEP